MHKYGHATSATGRITREIEKKSDADDRVKVQQPDYSKPRSLIAFKFINNDKLDEVDDRKEPSQVIVKTYKSDD